VKSRSSLFFFELLHLLKAPLNFLCCAYADESCFDVPGLFFNLKLDAHFSPAPNTSHPVLQGRAYCLQFARRIGANQLPHHYSVSRYSLIAATNCHVSGCAQNWMSVTFPVDAGV
jgi:hypothetical protein